MTTTLPRSAAGLGPEAPRPPRPARVTSLANLKGGVGKTTVAIHLAAALGRGIPDPASQSQLIPQQRVALIDLEPLCTATRVLGVSSPTPERSSAELFQRRAANEPLDAFTQRLLGIAVKAPNEAIDVFPAHETALDLADIPGASDYNFADNLECLGTAYDHIVIDLPATIRRRCFRSALIASDGVIIPIPPEAHVLRSMASMLETLEDIRRGQNVNLHVDGWLLSKIKSRRSVAARNTQAALLAESAYPTFQARIRNLDPVAVAAGFFRSVYGFGFTDEAFEAQSDFSAFALEWYEATCGTVHGGSLDREVGS